MPKGLLVRLHPACFSFLSAGQSSRMACAACGFRVVGVPRSELWRFVFWGSYSFSVSLRSSFIV